MNVTEIRHSIKVKGTVHLGNKIADVHALPTVHVIHLDTVAPLDI